ncbi:MAG: RDD family protein [Bacteroidetes bacterium]|nr:RDD family protein [Bacteroidota bacterium]
MLIKTVHPKRYLGPRIAATLIDYGIYFLLLFIYIRVFGKETDSGYEVDGTLALPVFAFWFLYFVVLEAYNGSTPGHDLMRLVVVKPDGEKIGLLAALKRRILDPIDIFFYGVPAMIAICKTPKFQRLGDLFADTLVVKKADITEREVVF